GEDVGAWLERQRRGWADLTDAQRQALAGVGVEAAAVPEQRAAPVDRWALTLAAAAAFREREGHLTVPRKHVEPVEVDGAGHAVKLGVALANARQRQATWLAERIEALSALGMRWS
ncbi:helicase associated domain-containing protein, partial [Streptomyces sp. SID3343]|uniref:helicase associated domain-containing protein n=1 Tax=Streptomyces sp. SID3343 TaxID=2690260 RepID=UPI0013BF0D29